MKTEINFFTEKTIANNNTSGFGHCSSYELGLGTLHPDDNDNDLSLMSRSMYSLTKSHHDQFVARRSHQLMTLIATAESIQSVIGAPVSGGLQHGGMDQTLYSGVPANLPHHLDIPNPISNPNPVPAEFGLGTTERRTRNCFDPNNAGGSQECNLSLALPQLTDNEEEGVAVRDQIDLDLKL